MIKKLIKLADKLDKMGLKSHANYVDDMIKKSMDDDSYSEEDTELDSPRPSAFEIPPFKASEGESYREFYNSDLQPIRDTAPQERFNKKGPDEHRRSLRDFFPGYEGNEDLSKVTMKDIMYPDEKGSHPAGRHFVNNLQNK